MNERERGRRQAQGLPTNEQQRRMVAQWLLERYCFHRDEYKGHLYVCLMPPGHAGHHQMTPA